MQRIRFDSCNDDPEMVLRGATCNDIDFVNRVVSFPGPINTGNIDERRDEGNLALSSVQVTDSNLAVTVIGRCRLSLRKVRRGVENSAVRQQRKVSCVENHSNHEGSHDDSASSGLDEICQCSATEKRPTLQRNSH